MLEMEADEAVRKAGLALGYDSLKVEQIAALCAFVGGRDVFVSLPTGYRKSLCYMLLPLVFDNLRSEPVSYTHLRAHETLR